MRKIGRRRLSEKLRRRKRKMSDAERNSELEQIKTHSMTEYEGDRDGLRGK